MRTIGVVSVGRSDYGIYLPILKRIQNDGDLRLHIFAGGMHLRPKYGTTIKIIEVDGFKVIEKIDMLGDSDSPQDIAESIGRGVIGFSRSFTRFPPDILVVLGDRFEMYSAALAALPFNIPIAHIHGGELTRGAIDDALRHSMTKLSHLHFVATKRYAKRVIQLGEEPWRVIVSGAPGLDNLDFIAYQERSILESRFGIDLSKPTLLVTFHPVTLEYEQVGAQIDAVLDAIQKSECDVLFTSPNADTGGGIILKKIKRYVEAHPNSRLIDNLGTDTYFSLMRYVAAMVGNSSSGIIEAPSFKLPVVNIGMRQDGRLRADNVIDVDCNVDAILGGIKKAILPSFRKQIDNMINPYKQHGNASEIIVNHLKNISLDDRLRVKSFYDLAERAASHE
jgi:UDP-hydrolysing UDP-N-acetyl-D-glucosamine 2-epimerase